MGGGQKKNTYILDLCINPRGRCIREKLNQSDKLRGFYYFFSHTHIRKYLNPSSFYLQHRSRQDFLFLSSSLYLLISLYYCVSFCCKLVTYRWISSNSISPLKNTFPICGIPKRETDERTNERTNERRRNSQIYTKQDWGGLGSGVGVGFGRLTFTL